MKLILKDEMCFATPNEHMPFSENHFGDTVARESVKHLSTIVSGPSVEFIPAPEEDHHKSSMELDPVVLLCHVSREDAQVLW